jgi:tetratricopeptide (TPR) repeat protein
VLPSPLLPNHPSIANRVAGVADGDPHVVVSMVTEDEALSWADIAAVARAHCELGNFKAADSVVDQLDENAPEATEFRAVIGNVRSYLHGTSALAAGDGARAARFFDDAYASAPGEAACALALAAALVASGDRTRLEEAADLYEQVALADPSWVAALAGLATVLTMLGRPRDAAKVLTAVPSVHPLRAQALTLACRAMQAGPYDQEVAAAAAERVRADQVGTRDPAEAELAASLYTAALAALSRGEQVADIGDVRAEPAALARGAEEALLDMAAATPDSNRRHALLDDAARTRPWSVW